MGSWSSSATADSIDPAFTANFALGMVGGIFLLVGLIFLIIGLIFMQYRKKKSQKCTATTTGIVTDMVSHWDRENGVTWSPLYEYEIDGLKYIKSPSTSTTAIRYAIGEQVEVRYNPQDPHECQLANDGTSKVLSLILTLLGGGITLIGAGLLIGAMLI